MVRRETRQMNDNEAAVLKATAEWTPRVTVRGTVTWVAVWTACLMMVGSMAYGLTRWTPPAIVGGLLGSLLGFAGILCLFFIYSLISGYIHWTHHGRDFRQHDVPAIHAALRDGTVHLIAVRATAVVTIQQFEDEGAGFIFDVGDGQVLFLKGQDYQPADDAMPWPNTEFEIVRSAVGNRWIGIFCSGAPLTPITILRNAECNQDINSADHEDIVDASMEEFVRSIRAVT